MQMSNTVRSIALFAPIAAASIASAQIRVTEIAPWSSGNSPVGADWFELTNTGNIAVDITGWRFDDNSALFGSSVALTGITSVAAGESVIFIETTSAATVNTFRSTWFGSSVPALLQIGTYSGSGIGLSTGGDEVNIFNGGGVNQAKVLFGASTTFRTFDNAQGLNGLNVNLLSTVGVNSAFTSAANSEVGSPGVIPAPSVAALLALSGVFAARRRR